MTVTGNPGAFRREGLGHGPRTSASSTTEPVRPASGIGDLADACDHIAESASEAGITRLEWLDVRQSAAHAFTWPVGRGIRPSPSSVSERVQQFAAGKEPEEAL